MVTVAFEWKLKPSALGICDPDDDLIIMAAYLSEKSDMTAYEEQLNKAMLERQASNV